MRLISLALLIGTTVALTRPHARLTIDTSVQHQIIDGFGCSEAFGRAEDVLGREGLSKANQSYVLDLLFDSGKGAGFTILRNAIGSSPAAKYGFVNSIEPVSPGSPSATPNYTFDGYDSGQFPLAQAAYRRGLKQLYAEAWSAPGFMKSNMNENYGGYLCGVEATNCSSGNWMTAYANYLVQYVKFYHENGVHITHLGFLNEPQENVSYASMLSDGVQAAEFIPILHDAVQSSGLRLEINCCDSAGWGEQEQMLENGLNSQDDLLSVITGHGYAGPPTNALSTTKRTWMTEWADLSGDYIPHTFFANGGPGEGMTWARNIQVAFAAGNVSAFLYWICAENALSSSSLINLDGNEVITSKRFWTFSQFSRWVRPGARRVGAESSDPSVTVTTFKNKDGSIAIQVINNSTATYELEFELVKSFRPAFSISSYLTNNQHDLAAMPRSSGFGHSFYGSIPARSLKSFVID